MNSMHHEESAMLFQQQAHFVSEIFNAPSGKERMGTADGMEVYRRNLFAVAVAALQVTYPTVWRLLGQPAFESVAKELLSQYPPEKGDWGQWGEELPSIIESSVHGDRFPFVAHAATLDWLRHCSNRASDSAFDHSTVQLLETHRLDRIGIELADHVGLVKSVFPLVEIFNWHGDESLSSESSTENFEVSDSPRPVLVYRHKYRALQQYISLPDAVFLQGVRDGRSIGSLLDELEGHQFNFPGWIAQGISQNTINRLYLIEEN